MAGLRHSMSKSDFVLSIAAIVFYATTVMAQNATERCKPPAVIPLVGSEPPAKIFIDPPLAGPLASRGVVIILYCAENVHLAPVFGSNALAVSPRVGHVHVRLDDAPWVWADASGNPIIFMGLPPGLHKVLIELEDANHHPLDEGTVKFVVPKSVVSEVHH